MTGGHRASSGELCSIEGCGRRVDAAGLCSTHRRRRRRGLEMNAPIRRHRAPVTISELLELAFELYELKGSEAEYVRMRRRFASMLHRWRPDADPE